MEKRAVEVDSEGWVEVWEEKVAWEGQLDLEEEEGAKKGEVMETEEGEEHWEESYRKEWEVRKVEVVVRVR